jgi:hypothetical protein
MTESNGQKHLLDAIERLLAGETVEPDEIAGDERRQLLELARDLRDGRPRPSAVFEKRLEKRIMEQAAATTTFSAEKDSGKSEGKTKKMNTGRWLPSWFTFRRVAAVSAALVIGLGAAGLTGALIRGHDGESFVERGRSGDEGIVALEKDSMETSGLGEEAAVAGSPDNSEDMAQSNAGVAGSLSDSSTTIPATRQVIRTADYEIEVAAGEFQDKYSRITDLATKYGGYVVSADTSASDDEGAINSGTIAIRIADVDGNFEQAMSELDGLGKVVSRDVSGKDVTDQYVDLQSRLRNSQAHETALLGLMEKATTVEEMLMVQDELNTVRAEIEQLQGQINYIENRSEYATISVDLHEEDAGGGGEGGSVGSDWGFTDALRYSGWLAVQTVNFVIMALGVVIPAALILVLLTMVTFKLAQRRK